MGILALWVAASTIYSAVTAAVPKAEITEAIGLLALAANLAAGGLLYRYRGGDSQTLSVWLCARNDCIANMAVMLAGAGVWASATAWPDICGGGNHRRPRVVISGAHYAASAAGNTQHWHPARLACRITKSQRPGARGRKPASWSARLTNGVARLRNSSAAQTSLPAIRCFDNFQNTVDDAIKAPHPSPAAPWYAVSPKWPATPPSDRGEAGAAHRSGGRRRRVPRLPPRNRYRPQSGT
jgi:hypothetical protein